MYNGITGMAEQPALPAFITETKAFPSMAFKLSVIANAVASR
jgi:hypothetical protein